MLRRSRRFEQPDYWILAVVGILCLIGVLMVFSSSGVDPHDPNYLIGRHVQWLVLGAVALVATMSLPYTRWRKYSVAGVILALVLLALVLLGPSFISEEIKGAKRWLSPGSLPISLQPSEFAKLAFIVYLADWCSTKGEKVRNFSYGLAPFGLMLGVLCLLVMLEPDMGTTLVIFAVGVVVYFASGAAWLHMGMGLGLAALIFSALAVTAPYRLARILAFTDPLHHDPQGAGYHAVQALLAFGSGGLMGMGLGASRQKFGWLPEQSTDAIGAIWGQETGFIGSAFLILLFLVIAWRGYRVARLAPDGFSQLLATGITTWVVFQAMLNIGAVSGSIPFTGVPLPFVSYGGSSLVITLAAVGLLLNISKHAAVVQRVEDGRRNTSTGREWSVVRGKSPSVVGRPAPVVRSQGARR
jgi:cell division protein FtsW